MRIPHVIDNQQHKLAGVLSSLLTEHADYSLGVATALRGNLAGRLYHIAIHIAAISAKFVCDERQARL